MPRLGDVRAAAGPPSKDRGMPTSQDLIDQGYWEARAHQADIRVGPDVGPIDPWPPWPTDKLSWRVRHSWGTDPMNYEPLTTDTLDEGHDPITTPGQAVTRRIWDGIWRNLTDG